MRSIDLGLVGFGAVCAVVISVGTGGCQSDDGGAGAAGPGGTGTGGSGAATGDGGAGGATTTSSSGTAGGGGAGGGGEQAQVVTIQEITTGAVGERLPVQVKGVVAMSRKWLVSKSNTNGTCLWGVFLSAPGLTETAESTGILAVGYGNPAVTSGGNTVCPTIAAGSVGGAIPDDVKAGDVLDVTGETSYFRLNTCDTQPADTNPTQVPQRQLAKVSKVEKTGTAAVPAPHTFSAEDVVRLASPSDPMNEKFHDKWGGVKVRFAGPLRPVPQGATPGMQTVVGQFGNITLQGSNIRVGDKAYYVGGSTDVCHRGPSYPDLSVVWDRIDGFGTLDFCTWTLQPVDKCSDFAPAGADCTAGQTCP